MRKIGAKPKRYITNPRVRRSYVSIQDARPGIKRRCFTIRMTAIQAERWFAKCMEQLNDDSGKDGISAGQHDAGDLNANGVPTTGLPH